MWKIWLFFSVFKFSFSAPVETKKGSVASTDYGGLRCLLLATPLATCEDIKRYGNDIPKRLQKLYDKVKKPFLEKKSDEIIDSSTLDFIPTSLLYLIPRIRLQNMTGSSAGKILAKSPDDESLAIKLSSILDTDEDRREFLEVLAPENEERLVLPSVGVERALGRTFAAWYPHGSEWEFWHFDVALRPGSPMLAHLPIYFLNRLTPSAAGKFVYHLRNWRPDGTNNSIIWASHSEQVKRMWTYIAVNRQEKLQRFIPALARLAPYLFLGATPEEMQKLLDYIHEDELIPPLFELLWSALQTRTLFDDFMQSHPNFLEVKSVKQLLPNLLPRQIRFYDPTTTDLADYTSLESVESFSSKLQFLEHQIVYLLTEKKLPGTSPSSWQDNIQHLGKIVHAIPASSLETFKTQNLSISTLNKIASGSLSYRQSRYLTVDNKLLSFEHPETILASKYHLRALPAAALNSQHRGLLPETVQRHLLRHIPADNRALASVLIEKTHLDVDDRPYLTALLENDRHEELLKLLSNRLMARRMLNWEASLTAIAHDSPNLKRKIRALPSNIGSMLLATYRKEVQSSEDGWTFDNLIENPKSPLVRMLISQLQCVDIELINDVDVLPVLGYYVRELRDLKLAFPKNMQYCCQKALTRYLKLKSSLRQYSEDTEGLMNLLEVFEVRAVGGYILASLPMDAIQNSHVKNHILQEIGSLPLPELLSATSLDNLRILANSFSQNSPTLHLREMVEMGNLLWFLNTDTARRINGGHLKLLLETFEPSQPRAPCLNARERELWRDILINAFGKPDSWTSNTLTVLGDLLYVFDEEDFESINSIVRTEAGDVLPTYTSFHVKVDWPGKLTPVTYFEACIEALPEIERPLYKNTVRTLIRFYLESAQMLANTVVRAEDMLQSGMESFENSIENHSPEDNDRIKRAIPTKRGRIFKRVLSGDKSVFAEDKRQQLLVNGTRSLTVFAEIENNTLAETESIPRKTLKLTCDAIRMVGMSASYVLDEEDFKKMTDIEIENCVELLGSLDLPQHVRKSIWPRLTKWKESNNLLEVGNLVSAISEDDILELSLDVSKPWSLESLAAVSQHVTHDDKLSLLGDRFILTNPSLQTGLRFGVAASLGRIMCYLSQSRQHKFLNHPDVFVQLAPILANVEMDQYCVDHLIVHAKTAFGVPSDWTAEDVASLGVIVAGLNKTDLHQGLKAEALAGLSPTAVSHIPPEVFKELSEEQLSYLPALSIAAISPAQSQHLSPSQSEVVERVRRQIPDKELRSRSHSGSQNILPSMLTIATIALTAVRIAF